MENLSGSTSFAFWSKLVICTATIFFLALMTLSFFLLVALPTKLLSPGDWAHWRFSSACSKPFFFLPKTGVLQNLHYQLSVFSKLTLPSSPAPRETLIWSFWPLQELPMCIWHSVEHLVCTATFGKLSGLHCGLEPLTYPPCPLSVLLPLPPSCAVPAPPSSSRARWHFVEQVPCVLWARPERTFCTRAH